MDKGTVRGHIRGEELNVLLAVMQEKALTCSHVIETYLRVYMAFILNCRSEWIDIIWIDKGIMKDRTY